MTDSRLGENSTMSRIVAAAGLAIGMTLMALVAILALVNRGDWWRGLLPAAMISVLAATASVPTIAWGLRRGLDRAVASYFVAAGLRMIFSLGGGAIAVWIGGFPPLPTLILMVVFYFTLLAAETATVVRVIWSAKA